MYHLLPHNSCNSEECYYYHWFPILASFGHKFSILQITFKLIYFFDRWCCNFFSSPYEWLSFHVHSIQLRLLPIGGCGGYEKFFFGDTNRTFIKWFVCCANFWTRTQKDATSWGGDECDGETCLLIKSSWHDGGYKWSSSSSWGVLAM